MINHKKLMNSNTIRVADDYISIIKLILANVEGVKGKDIILNGFIHREKDFSQNKIFISRYETTYCVADV
ncbi:hypothetical protein DN407_31280 (plasmid) [Bacillus sp. JAS24-2]|nr:hypothetical protein DN407_31280 [Bacillus sp. JAS24-2]